MKKILVGVAIAIIIFSITVCSAASVEQAVDGNSTQNNTAVGQVAKMKEKTQLELNDYVEKYGSESYGLTAFILKKVQVYSIPFCFLGVALSAIYQYIIGIRKLDTRDKGFYSLVGFVTIFVICQVLPLVFAIVIKGWGG